MLEKGIPHSPRGILESTPLMQAAQGGHDNVVRLLLDHGASVSDEDQLGRTALYWASARGHEKVAKELLARGGDLSIVYKGKTLLHLVVASRSREMVELLLHNGAAISARGDDGSTTLHIAAEKGDQEMIPFLLSKGSRESCVDKLGQTPLHRCSGWLWGSDKTTRGGRCGRVCRRLLSPAGCAHRRKQLLGERCFDANPDLTTMVMGSQMLPRGSTITSAFIQPSDFGHWKLVAAPDSFAWGRMPIDII